MQFSGGCIINENKRFLKTDLIMSEICKEFYVGLYISRKEAKEKLREVYKNANIKRTPKAIDLEDWFEIKRCTRLNKLGKKEEGFEILALKKT